MEAADRSIRFWLQLFRNFIRKQESSLINLQTFKEAKMVFIIKYRIIEAFISANRRISQFQDYIITNSLHLHSHHIQAMDEKRWFKECDKINSQKAKQTTKHRSNSPKLNPIWKKGEFKLFVTFLYYYLFIKGKSANDLENEDFTFLATIFLTKSILRLKYQTQLLFFSFKQTKRQWVSQEILLLKELVQNTQDSDQNIQWKLISYQLYEASQGKFLRAYDRCREMWTNHINPQIKHKDWTQEEDYLLLSLVQEIGKHWAKIVVKMGGKRTDHMIKNRYNSLILRQSKRKDNQKQIVLKLLETLQSNLFIKPYVVCIQPLEKSIRIQAQSLPKNIQVVQSQEMNNNHKKLQLGQELCSEASEVQEQAESESPSLSFQRVDMVQIIDIFPEFSKLARQDFCNNEEFRPILNDITQKLGYSHIEQVDFLFEDSDNWRYGQREMSQQF